MIRTGDRLCLYTETLFAVKKTEMPLGEHRWAHGRLAPGPRRGGSASEPDSHPAMRSFKKALSADGSHLRHSCDLTPSGKRSPGLKALGVTHPGGGPDGLRTTAVLDAHVKNLIQIVCHEPTRPASG